MIVTKMGFEHYKVVDIINGQRCEQVYLYYNESDSKCLFRERYKDEYELEREGELDMEGWDE